MSSTGIGVYVVVLNGGRDEHKACCMHPRLPGDAMIGIENKSWTCKPLITARKGGTASGR